MRTTRANGRRELDDSSGADGGLRNCRDQGDRRTGVHFRIDVALFVRPPPSCRRRSCRCCSTEGRASWEDVQSSHSAAVYFSPFPSLFFFLSRSESCPATSTCPVRSESCPDREPSRTRLCTRCVEKPRTRSGMATPSPSRPGLPSPSACSLTVSIVFFLYLFCRMCPDDRDQPWSVDRCRHRR